MPGFLFVQGYSGEMRLSSWNFLIEHPSTGRRVLFDLGIRKDLAYKSAGTRKLFDVWGGESTVSVEELMRSGGREIRDVEEVIFSHRHL